MAVLTHIEVAVNANSYVFFSFEQKKKGKETVSSMSIIQGSRTKLNVDLE